MALALSAIFVLIPFFAALVFVGPKMPVWFVTVMVALTGISESYRSVSITVAFLRLFQPFIRMAPPYGQGLGLRSSSVLIRDHCSFLWSAGGKDRLSCVTSKDDLKLDCYFFINSVKPRALRPTTYAAL